jgi:hypothetical protein
VMLVALGGLLAVARENAAGLRLVERTREQNARRSEGERTASDRDRGRRDGRARDAGARGGRRASHARG